MTPTSLADLPDRAPHVVRALHGEPLLRERLVELGFTPGQRVEILSRAAFGGPLRVRVRGGSLAIRVDEARCVEVTQTPAGAVPATPAAGLGDCACDRDRACEDDRLAVAA